MKLQNKIKQQVNQHYTKVSQDLKVFSKRALDLQVNLAVTGFSGAGKTAFISSLVHQLRFAYKANDLPFFKAAEEGRILGCKRNIQEDFKLNRFRYDESLEALCGMQGAPHWPLSTKGLSQICLSVKFKPDQGLLRHFQDDLTLNVNIIDYPGEWLLDLPMLNYDFSEWSQTIYERKLDNDAFKHFETQLQQVDWSAEADDASLEKLAEYYTFYLHSLQDKGSTWIQPGRFILPAELAGTPSLQFVPLPSSIKHAEPKPNSLLALNIRRFEHYKKQVIEPFYQNYFTTFDRQIILVDSLSALNKGKEAVDDLKFSLNQLCNSFKYGEQSWLSRVIAPKINKVLFAATKADHATPEQVDNHTDFLKELVSYNVEHIHFHHVDIEFMSIAALRASESTSLMDNGKKWPVVKGLVKGEDAKGLEKTKVQCLFPGEVPKKLPKAEFWQGHSFDFPSFLPPHHLQENLNFPHVAMDKVCEFLFGDKLK